MTHLQTGLLFPATAALSAIVGSVFDVKSRRIPNFVTGPSLLIGLAMHLALNGWRGLLSSLAAGLICGAIFLIFYLAGGMGAGDVKLIAAVGTLAGLPFVAYILVLTAVSGGVMALGLAIARGRLHSTVMNFAALTVHHSREGLQPHPDINVLNDQTLRLPYALAIAAGVLFTIYFQIYSGV